jgi:hypothetical protein
VRIDPVNMAIDSKNIGEVLFSTKNSACAAAVDFAPYLLLLRYLRVHGIINGAVKERLADIAAPLHAIVGREEIIEMQISD